MEVIYTLLLKITLFDNSLSGKSTAHNFHIKQLSCYCRLWQLSLHLREVCIATRFVYPVNDLQQTISEL